MAEEPKGWTWRGRRVTLLLAGPVLGGAERNALDFGRHLRAAGAEVGVVALDSGEGRAHRVAQEGGIGWSVSPVPWTGSRVAKAASLVRLTAGLRRARPDAIVAATNLPNVVGGLTWRAAGAATFVWTQCDVAGSTRIGEGLFRRSLAAAPLIETTAFHARDWLVERYGARRERIHVIRSEVTLPSSREDVSAWRSRLEVGGDRPVAAMVAHLHGGKDHATLLRAWRRVVDRLVDDPGATPVLAVAGRDAGAGDAAKALAFDLGLGDHVRFLGEVDDVSGLLAACDFAVFSTHGECLGRGATEPMYAGLPVIGSDVPGVREALGAPGEALLVPPGDVDALADTILRVVGDDELRRGVGRANAELIRRRQSAQVTAGVRRRMLECALAAAQGRTRV